MPENHEIEVFGNGVTEHLVDKLKDYDDRPNGVTATQLANGAVITEKLGDSSVTAQKLNNNAVTTPKLAGGSVTDDKLDPSGLISDVANIRQEIQNLDVTVDVDDFRLEQDQTTGLVYVVYRGERGSDGIPLAGGGGGGGGGNNAVLTVTNESGWLARTISTGAACDITIDWSSIEDGLPTGDGTLVVSVGGVVKSTQTVSQGLIMTNVGPLLAAGTNKVRVQVSDVYENTRTITFTVTSVELSLLSSFDTSSAFTANQAVEYTYIPKGSLEKTVHFFLDGTELPTETVTVSGRQQSKTLPAMAHGSHTLLVYFTATIDEQEVRSNELYYDLVVVDSSQTVPIIASPFHAATAKQYDMLTIPYTVYTPNSITSNVQLVANGSVVSTITVGRTEQTWSYRCSEVGTLELEIRTGTVTKLLMVEVGESEIDVHAETQDLKLYLGAYGRSNGEENPARWVDEDNGIAASLTGFDFVTNGWVKDPDGFTVLRVNNGARVSIPYKPFAQDFRTTGKTLEFEFAVRDVLDYDAVAMGSMSDGRGFQLTSQYATLRSEQSTITTQYKEDEHVRVSFVAQKRNEDRLLLIYIDGIVSGCIQYPEDDDFSQLNPVDIAIGADGITVDIYNIRVYDNDLTRYQTLENWIADTQDADLMLERYRRNRVYDEYGQVVIEQLPKDLPYMVLDAAELPQYKGDKKTITGHYVNLVNQSNSFSFTGCQINVQGTSSAPYAVKNYDMQYKEGFVTQTGAKVDNYALAPTVVPFNRFVLKADVASSESANNTELVMLFNDIAPYKRPEELADPKVRKGIYGFPIVAFWHDTDGDGVSLLGEYNFNLPKRAPAPYGYSGDMESWEFQNNTSDLMLFRSDYFDQSPKTDPSTGETKATWRYDYEARFPSDEWVNIAKLQEFQSFVYSTWRERATNATLPEPKTYQETHVVYDEVVDPDTGAISYVERVVTEDVTYTTDTAAYRLSKFHHEFGNYAEVDSFVFYYIFTELFLMVDSRAKNLFIGFSGGDATGLKAIDRKAVAEPYDMDTAIGTNNEGSLVFGYSLEDTDMVDGAYVFNGQNSVLWNNVRDAFGTEISSMYQRLRSEGTLSYASVEARYERHQEKWPEAIWNEDAWIKYINPLTDPKPDKEPTDVYLPMLQGSKENQRKWWLFNRFRYMDSKWLAGDATAYRIQLRGYAKADITVTPYSDIYPTVQYGSYYVSERGQHGVPSTLVCPLDNVNDTEIYVYSAPQIQSVGDLSGLKVGFADFSQANKLTSVVVGSAASGYENPNLTNLSVGTNRLLSVIDARNCTKLAGALDFSGAANIEHVYLAGTKVTSVSLPVGGILKTLQLPSTITNLTVRNQPYIETFDFGGTDYSSISTLRVENSGDAIPVLDILDDMAPNSRVRIIGFETTVSTTQDVEDFFDYLDTMRGLDEAGIATDKPVVAGTIDGLGTITGEWLARMNARYPDVTITYQHINSTLRYYSYDGSTLITSETITDGGNGTYTGTPSRTSTAQYSYTFAGWSLYKDQSAADPNATKNVTADRDVYAAYTATVRTYTVTWKNANGTTLETDTNVPYGSMPHYDGATPTQGGQTATGWTPTPAAVTGDVTYTAAYAPAETITDSWEQIAQHIEAGDYATRYSVGGTKNLDLGSMGIINMQIAGFDVDDLSDGSGKAAISWVSEQLLNTPHRMNPALVTNYSYDDGPSFARASSDTSAYDYNKWIPQNSNIKDEVARITIVATAKSSETLWVRYVTGFINNVSLKINGTEIVTKQSNSFQQYNMTPDVGTQYVFVYEVTCLNDSSTTNADYFSLVNGANNSGNESGVGRILTFDSIEIEDCTIKNFIGHESGTGGIGGWEQSEMRSYIDESVKPLIPSNVEKEIVEVTKHSRSCNTSGNSTQITTSDRLWVPSYREVYSNANFDTAGAMYSNLFVDNKSRKKTTVGSAVFATWWLRTSSDASRFLSASNSGGYNSQDAATESPVAFGFCTGRSPKQFGEITDSWDEIIANVNNGMAASKYAVGAYKPLDLGSEGVINMQIAAVNSDELADGSGTATLSFVGKELLKTAHRMNPSRAADPNDSSKYQEGTGTIGGWEKCEMRQYLADTILPLIPSNVAAAIKAVKKYSDGWSASNAKVANMETSDTLWIPSAHECFGATSFETSGPVYTDLFDSTSNRQKMVVGNTRSDGWWLRSAFNSTDARYCGDNGYDNSRGTNNEYYVALGFCL